MFINSNFFLKNYDNKGMVIQLKAKFMFYLCITILFFIPVAIAYSAYIQLHSSTFGYRFDPHILYTELGAAFLITGVLYLLIKGYFNISGHLMIIFSLMTAWTVMFVDKSNTIGRLDSIVFIIALLSMMPLVISSHKNSIILYGLINIIMLMIFIYFFKKQMTISNAELLDYLADNTITIFFICITSYNIFSINKKALDSAERDIKERKLAEEALIKSEAKFRTIFENANDEIMYVDMEGTVIDVNHKVFDIFGYTRDEIIGRKLTEFNFLTQEDMQKTVYIYKQASLGKIAPLVELEAIHKDNSPVFVEVNTTLIKKDGTIKGFVHIVRDITEKKKAKVEKKQLQTQLIQSQKMEAIGTLAGGVAHDFNNILSAIMGYTEMASMETENNSLFRKNLEGVLKAAHRAKDLVMQILTFSHQAEQVLKPIRIKFISKEALKLLRSSLPTTISIRQELQSDSITLADTTQIHQILMNLCTNAGHAMKERGGILEVSLTDTELSLNSLNTYPNIIPGPFLQLTVKDTGPGIPPDRLERIFEPYYTTKNKGEGTGLGLSVVHGIVTGYGGAITVDSEVGKGTTFKVLFPIIEKEEKAESIDNGPLPTGNECILFVDDESTIVDAGNQMLKSLGYEAVSITDSTSALELFKSRPDKYDLVVTDMTMPGMTGIELSKALRKIRSDIPLILCTGFIGQIEKEKAKSVGINALLMKPFAIKDLAGTIRKVLESK